MNANDIILLANLVTSMSPTNTSSATQSKIAHLRSLRAIRDRADAEIRVMESSVIPKNSGGYLFGASE